MLTRVLGIIIIVAAAGFGSPGVVQAQGYERGGGDVVDCYSRNYTYQRCNRALARCADCAFAFRYTLCPGSKLGY